MSDDERKDTTPEPDKAAGDQSSWEDSHTAASLPAWWKPEEPPAADSPTTHMAMPPAPPVPPTPPAPPNQPGMGGHEMSTQPPSPADWQGSSTAQELPSWWRPEQHPSTPETHTAATVPPAPHADPPAAPAPAMQAPPTPMAPPPQMAPAPAMPQATPPAPAMQAPPAPAPPHPSQPPPSRQEKTMVLGVIPAATPPMAVLVVASGPDMGFKFRVKPTVVASIGRDLANEIVLDDPAASRNHAQIEFQDGGYVLIDLGSVNGTLVNDQRVTTHRLTDGDRIKVGQDEIVISIM